MQPPNVTYQQGPDSQPHLVREQDIEDAFIAKLRDPKYTDRPDIRDRQTREVWSSSDKTPSAGDARRMTQKFRRAV